MKKSNELARSYDFAGRQEELYQVLERQVHLYTMGDHSSLPEETVVALLSSVSFCVQLALDHGGKQPESAPLSTLLKEGQRQVWLLTEEAKGMLARAKAMDGYGSLAHRDTLEAIDGFFTAYDMRFFAHDIPCMIDYPLCLPAPEALEGICFIRAYLERLILEQRFCHCFGAGKVRRLLTAFHPQYRVLVISLFEPVFAGALGLCLLGRDPASLCLDERDRDRLFQLLRPWEEERVGALVRQGINRLCSRFGLWDTPMRRYLMDAAGSLLPLLKSTARSGFENLFPSG